MRCRRLQTVPARKYEINPDISSNMDTVSGTNTTNDKTIILQYEIDSEDPVTIIATINDYGTLTVVIPAGDEDITLLMTKQ